MNRLNTDPLKLKSDDPTGGKAALVAVSMLALIAVAGYEACAAVGHAVTAVIHSLTPEHPSEKKDASSPATAQLSQTAPR